MTHDKHLDSAWLALRIGLGLMAFLAGADKFLNLLVDWSQYISPMAAAMLPVDPGVLMPVVGIVEMTVGVAILTRWTEWGAWVASAWLALIALNLVTTGRYFDVAVRDLELAIAAFALARLSAIRTPATDAASDTAAHVRAARI